MAKKKISKKKASAKKTKRSSRTGSVAANLHEGSRSEYLAHFVFSSFGTAIPVPHHEDTGLDIYCTLLERVGQLAWPRAYYSVQVKSTMEPWVFEGADSVRWIVEHPLPIFLCIVQKSQARILVYHTTPRFAVWALPTHQNRLNLIPGTETKGQTVDCDWSTAAGDTYNLKAPILNFTIQELLQSDFHGRAKAVLKHWIDYDLENLARIRNGLPILWVPHDYETNATAFTGWALQSGPFREDLLQRAQNRLKELLAFLATHHYHNDDIVHAAIYAMALRQLSPLGYAAPAGPDDPGNPHNISLHYRLNELFGMQPPKYVFQACDSLLEMVKHKLAQHGIIASH